MNQNENDPIGENIEYFTQLFLSIDSILQKSNDNLTLKQINEFTQFLSSQSR